MSRVEPERNRYVGHRYVPKIFGEWDKQNEYEGLSIVTHQGASYTSKKRVAVGIDILNEEYWVVTGNYDAQVENYRQETIKYKKDTEDKIKEYKKNTDDKINDYKKITDDKIDDYKKDTDDVITQLQDDLDKKIGDVFVNPVNFG